MTIFDWPARMRQMADFVGLTEDDLALIRSSAPALLPRADELAAAVYERFLSYPATARYFLHRDGAVNETRLARRKHSLARWLRNSIDFQIDAQFPVFLLAVGVVHSNPPLPAGRHGSVPARFMTGTISFIQSEVSAMLAEEIADDPARAMRTAIAWNKMLMLQLDVLLAGYTTEVPIPPNADQPHPDYRDDGGLDDDELDNLENAPDDRRRNGAWRHAPTDLTQDLTREV